MTTLTTIQMNTLQTRLASNDVAGFYDLLESYGDSYGRLGKEVTTNSGWQGEVAKERNGKPTGVIHFRQM